MIKITIPDNVKKLKLSPMKKLLTVVLSYNLSSIKKKKVLEIGCGDWDVAKKIFEKNKCQWFGLDILPTKLANVLGTVNHIPFPDESFDVVFCNQTIEHWYEYGVSFDSAFMEMNRVMKPGAILIITAPIYNHGHPYFLFDELDLLCKIMYKYFKYVSIEKYAHTKRIKGWRKLSDTGFFSRIGYPEQFFPNWAFTHQAYITAQKTKEASFHLVYKKDKFRIIKMISRFIKVWATT